MDDLPQLLRPGGSKYGLRDRIAANLDKAVEQVMLPNERLLWEISYPLVPQLVPGPTGVQMAVQMNNWLVLTGPGALLGGGSIVSATVCDLRKIADDPEVAVEAIRKLAKNIRDAVAEQLKGGSN